MKICCIDFEATGKEPKKARPIEIGVVLYDLKTKEREQYGVLIYDPKYKDLSEEVQMVTGLTTEEIKEKGIPWADVIKSLHPIMEEANYMVAHNAQYDRFVYGHECLRQDIEPLKKPWICTLEDIPWPPHLSCRKLSHLAFELGVDVKAKDLHRATEDAKLILDLIEASEYSWPWIIERFEKPKITVQAVVPSPFGKHGDGGKGKDYAKSLGYRYDGDSKMWFKVMPEDEFEAEKQIFTDYPLRVIPSK